MQWAGYPSQDLGHTPLGPQPLLNSIPVDQKCSAKEMAGKYQFKA